MEVTVWTLSKGGFFMFVERLSQAQVEEFIRKKVMEIHPWLESLRPEFQIDVSCYNKEKQTVTCHHEMASGHEMISLEDDRVGCNFVNKTSLTGKDNIVDREFEEDWIKYLYAIFGEEYKDWYMKKKSELFSLSKDTNE